MEARELTIPGAWEFTPETHHDERGVFVNPYVARAVAAAVGHPIDLAQTNHSVSRRGTVRGIHYALVPPGQAKYVYCPAGAVLDIVVDIRVGSPTFGRHEAVRLDAADCRAVYLAEGLGHAAVALEDGSVLSYLCSSAYDPEREKGTCPLDPALALDWPAGFDLLLSPRDRSAPTLAEAAARGLLPAYDECLSLYASLDDAAP